MSFDSYEYTSVIIPGALPTLTAWWFLPEVRTFFGTEGFELGELGIFFVVAFVVGHMVQAIGNGLEQFHGWIGLGKRDLPFTRWRGVDPDRWSRFQDTCRRRFGAEHGAPTRDNWTGLSGEVYAALDQAGMSRRLDAFTRTYGLMRGMVAGALVSSAAILWLDVPDGGKVVLGLCAFAFVMYARMWRFKRCYVRELVNQFLVLSRERDPSA